MSCLTCHDPHVQPTTNAVEYYRQKCLTCHSEQSCRLPLHDRQLKAPSDDCQGCHMPKQPVIGIAHSILTSHRIVKTPEEEFPNDSFLANKLDLGGLIHLDAIPGQPDQVPPLTLLHALGEIGTTDPSYVPSYLQALYSPCKATSTDSRVFSGLGWLHLAKGPDYDENQAKDYLSRGESPREAPNDRKTSSRCLKFSSRRDKRRTRRRFSCKANRCFRMTSAFIRGYVVFIFRRINTRRLWPCYGVRTNCSLRIHS